MIDIRKLKELVKLMVENDLSELDLKDQSETVAIKRNPAGVPVVQAPTGTAHGIASPATADQAPAAESSDNGDAGIIPIESPMVGTFYSAASPDSPPFVSPGTEVSPDTVICLIEAMKVFNEIKAEQAGRIERVCVKNGEAVEFGQRLFELRPA